MPDLQAYPIEDDTFWQEQDDYLASAMQKFIESAALFGIYLLYDRLTTKQKETISINDIKKSVSLWAKDYSTQLAHNINLTTIDKINTIINVFNQSQDATKEDLVKAIQSIIGEHRSQIVGVTETTVSISYGKMQIMKELGINSIVWVTAQDERVCKICSSKNGKTYPLKEEYLPPAHPFCRCTFIAKESE